MLDRPNPIDGFDIEGPDARTTAAIGFIGYLPMPIRHGLTLGELAQLFNGERKIGADLTVVPMKNWRRDDWFDDTGLPWMNPSPNMRNLIAATLYPGIGAIESTNISVGRGTDTPFEQIGAPWIDGGGAGGRAQRARPAGRPLLPGAFTPAGAQARRPGVPRRVHGRHRSRSLCGRCASASRSRRRCRGCTARSSRSKTRHRLFGSTPMLEQNQAGEDPAAIAASWAADEAQWRLLRAKYLLYRSHAKPAAAGR